MVTPVVRVRDASLVAHGGPARLVISRLSDRSDIAAALRRVGARCRLEHDRLEVVTTIDRLEGAVQLAHGRAAAQRLRGAVETAMAGWHGPAPDLYTSRGVLRTSRHPVLMGVLNVTPDSFSDGGRYLDLDAALAAGMAMVDAGASVVDVGGESTRPGAAPVSPEEELARVVPVVGALAERGIIVSIDTSKAVVVRAAIAAGAVIVNDISAGSLDPDLLPTVASLQVPYVLMHLRGTPRTMQQDPVYDDVVAEVYEHLYDTRASLVGLGYDPARLIVDPGIGFGKTREHNLELLACLRELSSLGAPVLVGASRKSFIGATAEVVDPRDRLPGSLASAAVAVAAGARLLRVHDVAETRQAVAVAAAIAEVAARDPLDPRLPS